MYTPILSVFLAFNTGHPTPHLFAGIDIATGKKGHILHSLGPSSRLLHRKRLLATSLVSFFLLSLSRLILDMSLMEMQ